MFMKKNDGLRELRKADPRSQTGFEDHVSRQATMRGTIVASDPGPARAAFAPRARPQAAQPARSRAAHPSRRLVGLSAGAAVGVAVVVVAAVLLLGGGNPSLTPTPALAAEAAKKAAVDTTTAAKSGVIKTVLLIDGEAQVMNRISWNGADLALLVQDDQQRQIRYVDGLYYETYGYAEAVEQGDTSHDGQWFHVTSYDDGSSVTRVTAANEEPTPAQWLIAARTDLAGDGLVALVTEAQGFTRTTNDDGSVTYAATTTVAAIQSEDMSIAGLPVASQPSFKVKNLNTPVAVKVVVGGDGLIQELKLDWTLDLPGEASKWSYTTTYSDLGNAAAIEAPDPGHTATTDTRFPPSVPGPM
jgi:hypothetical protein